VGVGVVVGGGQRQDAEAGVILCLAAAAVDDRPLLGTDIARHVIRRGRNDRAGNEHGLGNAVERIAQLAVGVGVLSAKADEGQREIVRHLHKHLGSDDMG
jgi:hypothetical protein